MSGDDLRVAWLYLARGRRDWARCESLARHYLEAGNITDDLAKEIARALFDRPTGPESESDSALVFMVSEVLREWGPAKMEAVYVEATARLLREPGFISMDASADEADAKGRNLQRVSPSKLKRAWLRWKDYISDDVQG